METKPAQKKYLIPASVFKRIGAFAIDLLILNVFVMGPFSGIFESLSDGSDITFSSLMQNESVMQVMSSVLVVISILSLVYFVVLQLKFAQTIGMMILNIYAIKIPTEQQIVHAKKAKKMDVLKAADQFRLRFFDALIRNMFILPFFPFIILWIVDPIYYFFSKSQQRFTESISKTTVVEFVDFAPNDAVDPTKRWL